MLITFLWNVTENASLLSLHENLAAQVSEVASSAAVAPVPAIAVVTAVAALSAV